MVIIICAWCKEKMKMNDIWQAIAKTTELNDMVSDNAVFSHGVCPDCCETMHEDMAQMLADEKCNKPVS